MPQYWNPNNFYPATYHVMSFTPSPMPQQSYATQPSIAAAWVDGEMEARGKSIPQGVSQFFMVDVNNQKIYWKSLNQMGMPNPMQVLNFTIEGQQQNLSSGMSGDTQPQMPDMSQFATKQDFEALRNEIRQMGQSGYSGTNNSNNNNTSGQNGNRGGNR